MKITAVCERVVVKPLESPKETPGGIHLVEDNETTYLALVLSVGDYVESCEAGNKVLLSKASGVETEVTGERLVIVEEKHILAVVSEEN